MRKLAGRLLCELAYKNEKAQVLLCECFSFTPIKGQVALNPIPPALQNKLKRDPSILNQIKSAYNQSEYSDASIKQGKQKYWSYP